MMGWNGGLGEVAGSGWHDVTQCKGKEAHVSSLSPCTVIIKYMFIRRREFIFLQPTQHLVLYNNFQVGDSMFVCMYVSICICLSM